MDVFVLVVVEVFVSVVVEVVEVNVVLEVVLVLLLVVMNGHSGQPMQNVCLHAAYHPPANSSVQTGNPSHSR